MIPPPHAPEPIIEDWLNRHRALLSLALHAVGVPATILGALMLPIYVGACSLKLFGVALMLFLGGFALQFLAHALEGSEPGELAALRAWWRRRNRGRSEVVAEADSTGDSVERL